MLTFSWVHALFTVEKLYTKYKKVYKEKDGIRYEIRIYRNWKYGVRNHGWNY